MGAPMMRHVLWLGCLVAAGFADAQTMYRCEINGKVEYSDKPCMEGVEVKRIAPDGGPTPEDRARAQMRVRAEQQRLDAQDRAEAQQRRFTGLGELPPAQASNDCAAHTVTSDGNEKVPLHTRDGWD